MPNNVRYAIVESAGRVDKFEDIVKHEVTSTFWNQVERLTIRLWVGTVVDLLPIVDQ